VSTFCATFHGRVIAESDETILLEGVRYFPGGSVDRDSLNPSWKKSLCLWKGVASYYTISTSDSTARNSAWTYRHPLPLARHIKDHIAFAPDAVVLGTI
jgi:uncharacterized protein (DUF427 family)